MTLAIKTCFIIIKDCINLFLASLKVHIFYKENKTFTLPTSFNRSFLSLNIPELNNYICDEFVLTMVKNEVAYTMATKVKEI